MIVRWQVLRSLLYDAWPAGLAVAGIATALVTGWGVSAMLSAGPGAAVRYAGPATRRAGHGRARPASDAQPVLGQPAEPALAVVSNSLREGRSVEEIVGGLAGGLTLIGLVAVIVGTGRRLLRTGGFTVKHLAAAAILVGIGLTAGVLLPAVYRPLGSHLFERVLATVGIVMLAAGVLWYLSQRRGPR